MIDNSLLGIADEEEFIDEVTGEVVNFN
jgi:hypothetical protein